MDEPGDSEISTAQVDQPVNFLRSITSLRLQGAEQFDPIGLHYIAVLAARTNTQRHSVKRILEEKLVQALAAFEQRFQQAQDMRRINVSLTASHQRESLGDLARCIAQHASGNAGGPLEGNIGPRTELKSVRHFRNTWSKLSANKQVAQALDQAPKNAGPINSHMLVLRSLTLMRDVSPDYLNRFVSYVDTLMCLDQTDQDQQATVRVAADGKKRSKSKPRQ